MQVQPYLFFDGTCEAAVEFYRKTLGAEVTMLMRYKDSPDPKTKEMCSPGSDDKVMHTSFKIGNSLIMASDGAGDTPTKFEGFSLSLAVSSVQEVERYFAALADGGKIQMPLMKTFWSPMFGMVVDRFGVAWMVTVAP